MASRSATKRFSFTPAPWCGWDARPGGRAALYAAARGTPAIVADLPVFDETFGDAAVRVPVGDPGALAAALLRLEQEPDFREKLAADAQAAVGRLSWERAAQETRAALLEAAS